VLGFRFAEKIVDVDYQGVGGEYVDVVGMWGGIGGFGKGRRVFRAWALTRGASVGQVVLLWMR
jgi:hypothetical protein